MSAIRAFRSMTVLAIALTLGTLVFDRFALAGEPNTQIVQAGCPAHSSPARRERVRNEIHVICKCDSGYFKAKGQCRPADKARAILVRELQWKLNNARSAMDRVKHTSDAFAQHIDSLINESLRDSWPEVATTIGFMGGLVAALIAKSPELAAGAAGTIFGTTSQSLNRSVSFIAKSLRGCAHANAETLGLCNNLRLAVRDLPRRLNDAWDSHKELRKLNRYK